MRNDEYGAMPRRRTKGLVVRAHGEETLVLDRRRLETVHCLPADVSRVWDACTGKNTLAEIATTAGIDEPTVASAIDQLIEQDLLETPGTADRRKFLQRTAFIGAGAVAAAGIQTIVSSPAWAAASFGSVSSMFNTGACSRNKPALGPFTVIATGWPIGVVFNYQWIITDITTGTILTPPTTLVNTFTGTAAAQMLSSGSITSGSAQTDLATRLNHFFTVELKITRIGHVFVDMVQTFVFGGGSTPPFNQAAHNSCVFNVTPPSFAPAPVTSSPSTSPSSPDPTMSSPGATTSGPAPANSSGSPQPTTSP